MLLHKGITRQKPVGGAGYADSKTRSHSIREAFWKPRIVRKATRAMNVEDEVVELDAVEKHVTRTSFSAKLH
jgi:hypothetical protein